MKLITRSDDLGLNNASNLAILQVAKAGFIKNISVMATGAAVESAANMLKDHDHICFGMHGILTSEWDGIKWGSLSHQSVLEDDFGHFPATQTEFATKAPPVEAVLAEYECQLNYLYKIGFNIQYVDSHMEVERTDPQLFEAIRQWAHHHGIVFAGDYLFPLSPQLVELPNSPDAFVHALEQAQDGIRLYVGHPAFYTQETKQLQNQRNPGRTVALQRYLDYLFAVDPKNSMLCQQNQITLTGYHQL